MLGTIPKFLWGVYWIFRSLYQGLHQWMKLWLQTPLTNYTFSTPITTISNTVSLSRRHSTLIQHPGCKDHLIGGLYLGAFKSKLTECNRCQLLSGVIIQRGLVAFSHHSDVVPLPVVVSRTRGWRQGKYARTATLWWDWGNKVEESISKKVLAR